MEVGPPAFPQFEGTVYRATTYDEPLWVWPNSREGRWNSDEETTIAQYCSLDPSAAVAELVRHENLRDPDEAAELTVDVWELRVSEGAVVTHTSIDQASTDLSLGDLTADDWGPCQFEGERLQALGVRGILAPNAALPGSVNLTLFGERTEIDWDATPRVSVQVPCRFVLRASPGPHLVGQTRFFGESFPPEVQLNDVDHYLSRRPGL
ncbi:MAG: RES family NAD+ phosphorylase [Solirubrobacterales bacterium]